MVQTCKQYRKVVRGSLVVKIETCLAQNVQFLEKGRHFQNDASTMQNQRNLRMCIVHWLLQL